MDLVGSSTGAVVDSFTIGDTEAVDLLFFPAFVFLEGPSVDSMGSSKGAVVDSSAADGTEGVDLLSFPALVFFLGGAMADSVDSCTRAVVDPFAIDGTRRGGLSFCTAFAFLERGFLEEGTEGVGFLDVFSTARSTRASLLPPLPRYESIMRRFSITVTEFLQASGRCMV